MKIKIDGNDFNAPLENLRTMGEVVELIKASIDPDTIIISMIIQGNDLSEADWRVPIAIHRDSTLEIQTGSRENFVRTRLTDAPLLLQRITVEIEEARVLFQKGAMQDANTKLAQGIKDLKAFIPWYKSVLNVIPGHLEDEKERFRIQIAEITKICEQILQQQLYQSWWAIGETLKDKLEPQLNSLSKLCEMFGAQGV